MALVAGRGAGKTWAGAARILLRAAAEHGQYAVVAPTYTMLADINWPKIAQVADQMRLPLECWQGQMRMKVAGRSEIRFRSADRPDRLRGLSLNGLWLEEASTILQEALQVLLPTLREGPAPWLAATLTPKGRTHWTYDWFGTGQPGTEVIRAATSDNHLLNDSVRQQLYSDLVGVWAKQELEAEFLDPEGAEWSSEHWGDWVLVQDLPHQRFVRRVIAVDPSLGAKTHSGDFSAIVGLGVADGLLWAEANLARRPPHQLIADTLVMADRWKPHAIGIEAVAFQSLLVSELARQRRVPWPLFGIQADGPKELRIRRLGPAIVRRELRILDNEGGRLLYQQLRDWPEVTHDDGPDALEMALRLLTEMR